MDEIIKKVRELKGYRMGDRDIKILCYADDSVLIGESEDDVKKLLQVFNRTAKQLNMNISTAKTKCMTTSKTPLRCKLVVDGKIIHQEMKFKYLGVEISEYGDVEIEVCEQTNKAARIAACVGNIIWRNKHMRIETKARIYKATIRPIMTYTAEIRPETTKTRRMLETTEIKILRIISRKTMLD